MQEQHRPQQELHDLTADQITTLEIPWKVVHTIGRLIGALLLEARCMRLQCVHRPEGAISYVNIWSSAGWKSHQQRGSAYLASFPLKYAPIV